jgi:ATP-dependent RNA helicase DHX29
MPPKKKKTQLKPIARGFATTSQPKKIAKEDPVEPESTASLLRPDDTRSESHTDQVVDGKSSVVASISEIDTDVAEEQFLQNLVEKLQDKTEKEIIRFLLARFPFLRSHLSLEPLRLCNSRLFYGLWFM